jgi:hypothetical protein
MDGLGQKKAEDVELEDLDEEERDKPKGWRLVQEKDKASHGNISLRADLKEGYTWCTEVEGGWYTFSVDALSRTGNEWLKMTAEDIRGSKGEVRNRQDSAVQLGPKWKRCVFSFNVVRGPVAWTLETLGDGTVWVDAAQLEAGQQVTPFQLHPWDQDPPKDIEEKFTLGEPACNGLAPFDPAVLSKKGQDGTVALRVGVPDRLPDGPIPATGGIPIPRGHIYDDKHVVLKDSAGKEAPLQTRVLSRHVLDGSVQMLLVDLQAPKPDATYELAYGPGVERSAPAGPLSASEDDNQVSVCTGPLKFTVRKRGFNLLDSLWIDANGDGGFQDEEQVVVPGAEQGVWTADPTGRMHWSSNAEPEYVRLEENGPNRCCIAASGTHRSKQGQDLFRYVVRLHAYAGKPYLRVEHVFSNEQPPYSTVLTGAGIRVGLRPGAFESIGFTTGSNTPVAMGEELYLAFPDLVRKWSGDQVTTFKRDGRGWATVEGKGAALTAAIREWDWMPPKEFWFSPDKGLDLCVWPRHLTRGLCVPMGTARTHRLWLHFHKPGLLPEERQKWLTFFSGDCLVQARPEWYCDSTVFGQLAHYDAQRMPRFETMLCRKGDGIFGRFPRPGEYGWNDFITYGDDRGDLGWGNMETMLDHAMFLLYVRSLDPWHYRRAYDAATHYRDVDVCHPWGQTRVHCHNHTLSPWDGSHCWIKGVLDHYLLTGDVRSLEVANEHGRWIRTKAFDYEVRGGSRRFTRLVENLADLYRITGHKEYLENFTARIDYAEKLRGDRPDQSRFNLGNLFTESPRPAYGTMGFPQFYALEGVMQMAKATEDKRWIDMFKEEMKFVVAGPDGADLLKDEAASRAWGAGRGKSIIESDSRNRVFLPCMNYLFELTGDAKLIESVLYAALYATTDNGWKDWYPSLGYSGLVWFAHALYHPLKSGLTAEREAEVREAARALIIPSELLDPGFEQTGPGGNRRWAAGAERQNLSLVFDLDKDEAIRHEGKCSLRLSEKAVLDKLLRKKYFGYPYTMTQQKVFIKDKGFYQVVGHFRWLNHGRPAVTLTIDEDLSGQRDTMDLNLPALLPERNYDDIKTAPKLSAENLAEATPGAEPEPDARTEFEGPKKEIGPTDCWWRFTIAFEITEPSTLRFELTHLLGLRPPGTVWFDDFDLKRLPAAPKDLKKPLVEMLKPEKQP